MIREIIPPFSSMRTTQDEREATGEINYTFDDAAPFLLVAVVDAGRPPLAADAVGVLRRAVHGRDRRTSVAERCRRRGVVNTSTRRLYRGWRGVNARPPTPHDATAARLCREAVRPDCLPTVVHRADATISA